MSDHIHHRLSCFYKPNLRYLRGHALVDGALEISEVESGFEDVEPMAEPKKNLRHAGESTESQAVGGLG